MRCACRRGKRSSTSCRAARSAAWRCAGCCCPRPTCCCSTSRPTTSTPSRSPGWSSYLEDYPCTVVAVTHDRYFLDNVAEWILELDRGHGIPWKGNYSIVAGTEGSAPRNRRERPRKACARCWRRNSNGCARIPRHARPRARRACNATKSWPRVNSRSATRPTRSTFRPGERLGDLVIESKGLRKAYGDRLLFDNLNFNLPAGGIVGIIGPNGAGKTTLVPHDRRAWKSPTPASCASGPR